MKKYMNSSIGRLRFLGFLEGLSLLILVFVAVPLKYLFLNPIPVKWVGQVHGILFVLFVFNSIKVSVEEHWSFKSTTWKVIFACFIPFGTFYVDRKFLAKAHELSDM